MEIVACTPLPAQSCRGAIYTSSWALQCMLHLETSHANYTGHHSTTPAGHPPTMEGRDHGRGLKQLPSWTLGQNFSLAGGCFPWRSLPSSSSSSYTCSYCRREFRSAQALGGHMNVHRRDRARLRQCCPAWTSSSLPSTTNMAAAAPQQHRDPLPNLNYSPPHCAGGPTAAAEAPVIYSFFSTATSTVVAAATKPTTTLEVSLELGIGVCGGHSGEGLAEEGLDLELRLGCAWE
ncbi:uncharacterized protein [Setaria viridis]|uniref:uncharacterized protein n=1 Tax=Setaria viridis TaxID=4556 RepID=UPI00149342BA|nr:transcriptional regulator SUPERMAN-like [Setaria viridis]